MRIKAQIVAAEDNEYQTKAGTQVKECIITLLDRSEVAPMKVTFDVKENNTNAAAVAKLFGDLVEVDLLNFEVWRGRLRAEGGIVNFAKPSNGSK